MGCLHTNYIENNTLENSQIQKDINKKERNHTRAAYNDKELLCHNLTLKCSSATKKCHYWNNEQNCTRVYSPDPSHSTPTSENTRPELTKAMYTINKTCWPVLSLIRTANTKLAHPMGCLHTNYIENNTLENSQLQKDINKKERNHTTLTYNDTRMHCPNLNLKRSSVTEKTHYWTNVQNCTTVYILAPSHNTPNSENTRPELTRAMYTINKTCRLVLSLIRTANTKLAHPMGLFAH
jgi:hypothetical protein